MAYDYEKVKQAYEGLDAQQRQQFADMMKWSGNYADFMSRYNAEKTPTATASTTTANSSTPTQTSTSRDIAKPEYQWTWSIWTKTSPYENQGEWNYYYSNQTNRYEKYPTATQTSTQTTKVGTPAENDTVKQLRDAWNNKSYEEQQKLLKSNPAMQNTLTKYWITNKQPEATPAQTPTQTPTTQKDKEWDYQDNSQARMDEIIRNLDWFRVTNPYLFDNYDTFYNAFIAGKGRSQDQIKTLNDYFKKMKQYNKYDNLSSDEVGWMIARWEIPDDYLNYLKNSDPQRWAEIQWVRKDVEDQIMNESYLNTIASDAWFDMWENDFMKWQKWTFWLEDKNSDWLWDIIYHAPTQEELDLNNEDNEYEAEKLRIKNAYKDLQSDLADQYPDADLSTIMVLAWDRGNKMMKALDSISVAQTKTQWRLKYLQNERAEMDKVWQAQINELQQNLWMYYQYTPEWMSELAQAQYAATNVTLDQADNGTDAQKQMALQRVLDDYYAKYWDIIQRSEAQVINDVMALAKQKGISLSQALEENFLKYLRQKPWFEQLSTIATVNPEIVKVWDNAYAYWDDNWNLVSIWWTLWANWVYQFSDAELRTVGSDGKFTDTVWNDINSIWHILNSEDWLRIGTYTNPKWYTYNVYATREDWIQATENLLKRAYYWMTLWDAAQKWIWQWKDISDAKKVIQSKWLWLNDKLSDANVRKFIEAIWTREWTLKWKSLDEWAKWWKTLWTPRWTEWWQKRNPELETFLDKWKDAEWDRLKEKDFWSVYWKELEAKWVSKEDFLKQFKEYYTYQSRDAYLEILSNLDHLIELTWKEFDRWERASALSWLWDAGKVFKYIKNNLTVNWLQEARDRWLKLWVLSDSDVKMIAEASSVLDWDVSQWTWNRALQDFRQSLLNNNPYLKEQYKYQSAYSPNVWFKYNDNDKSFTFWTRKDQSWTQWTTQWTTTQAKSIKNLWK